MRRKLFNTSQPRRAAAVAALLLVGRAAQAQEATQAKMWAAAARYVYADDPNLKPLVSKLDAELGKPQTLNDFEQRLLAASDEVAKASKTPNVRVLQRQFGNMRTMNALQLYKNLPDSLGKMPARTSGERKQKLAALGTTLMALAQNTQTAPPSAAAADETEPAPGPVVATPPPAAPATSPWVWAAVAMSGLSLLGVARLLLGRQSRSLGSASSSGSGRSQPRQELSAGQYQEVKSMIEAALASSPSASAPAAKPAPARPTSPPAPPQQSTKQKLANAARTTLPSAEAPTAPLPPLSSLAPDAPAAPPVLPIAAPALEPASVPAAPPVLPIAAPALEPASVPAAPVLEAIPAVMEPGTSVELDPTPAPVPAQRLQFVNEAPFNNTFAARTLSDAPATYSIYEIMSTEQTPDLGQFRVVGNLVSHISNHRNILEPVCEYVAYPQGGETRIVTEQAGEVRRRGADWEIVRPARIRFE